MEEPTEHAVTHHGYAAEAEHEAASLLQEMRHRLIHWPSMSRPLRLVTGLAVAQIIAAAVIVVLGAVPSIGGHFASVSLYTVDNQLVSTSMPVFIATLVFVAAAWGYLLSGVAHGHPVVQVTGLALFTWLTFSGWDQLTIDVGTLWVAIALVAAIWLVAGGAMLLHRRARLRHGSTDGSALATAATVVLLALLVGGLYLNSYAASRSLNAPLLFTGQLSLELSALSVLLIPLLLMAGVDFAELADLVGRRAGAFTARRFGARALAGLTAAVVLAVLAYQLARYHDALRTIAVDVGVGVVAFAVIAALLWAGRTAHRPALHHVPTGAVALVAVVSYGLTYTLILIPAENASAAAAKSLPAVNYGPYAYTGSPQFHLEKPSAWETATVSSPGSPPAVSINGSSSGDAADLVVTAYHSSDVTPEQALSGTLLSFGGPKGLWAGGSAYLDNGHHEGPFRVDDVHSVPIFGGTPYRARAWSGTEGGYTWLIFGVTPDKYWSFNGPMFDHMASTFGLGPSPPAAPDAPASTAGKDTSALATIERPETITLGTLLLIALLALAAARYQPLRRVRERITTAAIFLTIVAVMAIAALPNYVIDTITNTPGHNLTPFHLEGIQTLIGLASLAWLVWVLVHRGLERSMRTLQLVLTVNIGLQIVAWFYDLYAQSQGVPNFTVAQAVILLLAFLVDVLLSGEGITNRDGPLFPRRSRVHLYFGYVLLTVAVVLYFSSLRYQASGDAVASQFESDAYPQTGLLQFGVPLLFTMFLLAVFRIRGGASQQVSGPEVRE